MYQGLWDEGNMKDTCLSACVELASNTSLCRYFEGTPINKQRAGALCGRGKLNVVFEFS